MERTTEILQHQIDYWYRNDQEMPEHEETHVQEMITDGYSGGQLVDEDPEGNQNTGWWEINYQSA